MAKPPRAGATETSASSENSRGGKAPPLSHTHALSLSPKTKNKKNRQLRDSIIGKTPAEDDDKNDDKNDNDGKTPLLTFPDASFLDASLVPDLWTLRLAAFAAEAAGKRGRARSRSRHTELVVALSGGKNVSSFLFFFLSFFLNFFLSLFFCSSKNSTQKRNKNNSDLGRAGDVWPLRRGKAPAGRALRGRRRRRKRQGRRR